MSGDSAFEGGDFFKVGRIFEGAINKGMAGNRGERVYDRRIHSSVIIHHFLFSCATWKKMCGQNKYTFVFEINSYK